MKFSQMGNIYLHLIFILITDEWVSELQSFSLKNTQNIHTLKVLSYEDFDINWLTIPLIFDLMIENKVLERDENIF